MSCLRNCVSARRARGWPLAGPDDPIRRRRPEALPLAIEVAPWLTRAPGPWTTSGRIQRARLGATRGPGARPAAEVRISGSRRRSRAASDRAGRRPRVQSRRRADRRSRTSSCCVQPHSTLGASQLQRSSTHLTHPRILRTETRGLDPFEQSELSLDRRQAQMQPPLRFRSRSHPEFGR